MDPAYWTGVLNAARAMKAANPYRDSAEILRALGVVPSPHNAAMYVQVQTHLLNPPDPFPLVFPSGPAQGYHKSSFQVPPYVMRPALPPVVVEAAANSRLTEQKSTDGFPYRKTRDSTKEGVLEEVQAQVVEELEKLRCLGKAGLNEKQVDGLKKVPITVELLEGTGLKEAYEKAVPVVVAGQKDDKARNKEVGTAVNKWVKVIAKVFVGEVYRLAQDGNAEPPRKKTKKLEEVLEACYDKDVTITSLQRELNEAKGSLGDQPGVAALRGQAEKKEEELVALRESLRGERDALKAERGKVDALVKQAEQREKELVGLRERLDKEEGALGAAGESLKTEREERGKLDGLLKKAEMDLVKEKERAAGLREALKQSEVEKKLSAGVHQNYQKVLEEVDELKKSKQEAEAKIRSLMGTSDLVTVRAQLRKSQQSDASFIHREPVTITARAQLKKSQGLVAFLKEQVDMHKKSIEKLHKERRETEADSIPSRILDLAIEAALCTLAPPKEDVRAPLYAPDLNLLTYLVEAGFLKELPEIAPASLTDWDRWEWDRAVLKIHLRRFCQNNGRTLDVNHILRSLFGTESGVLVLKLELPHMPERDILYLQYQHLASLQKVKIKSLLGMPDWVCYLEWWKKAVEEYVLYQKREVQVTGEEAPKVTGTLRQTVLKRFRQLRDAYTSIETNKMGQLFCPMSVRSYDTVAKPRIIVQLE